LSFAAEVKQELDHVARERPCCRTAELAALLRASGTFHIKGGGSYGLHASFGLSSTARSAIQLIKSFRLPVEVRVREERRLSQGKRYEVYLEGGDRLVQFLNETGVLSDSMSLQEGVPERLVRSRCCKAAFLRGAFLGAGSVSEPGAPAHLEIYSDNEAFLQALLSAASGLELRLSITRRKKKPAVYAKRLDVVIDFLVKTGAHQAALRFEERSIVSSVRADANRRANFDQANAARCSRAAARQIRAIEALQRWDGWPRLSPRLTQVAELRLRHPSATLHELGRRASPPLSKSAVNHRLRRLVRLAEERTPGFE